MFVPMTARALTDTRQNWSRNLKKLGTFFVEHRIRLNCRDTWVLRNSRVPYIQDGAARASVERFHKLAGLGKPPQDSLWYQCELALGWPCVSLSQFLRNKKNVYEFTKHESSKSILKESRQSSRVSLAKLPTIVLQIRMISRNLRRIFWHIKKKKDNNPENIVKIYEDKPHNIWENYFFNLERILKSEAVIEMKLDTFQR